jgi:prophage antirepressor-like protein
VNALQVFNFQEREVRFVGTAECPEWVAQDICSVLELKGDAGQHLRDFDDEEKGLIIIQTLGSKQELLTVTEPDFYRLVFKSRKKVAKDFQK